ncbi:DNA polymerase family A-domain-containing protein [Amanita rubescens]|nr:DNA polymerase family A-domain-containing protein [Amanita rubescens]
MTTTTEIGLGIPSLVRITYAIFPPLVPGPDSNPNPNLDLEDSDPSPPATDSDHLSLADLLSYCATDVHAAHKVYSAILLSFLSRCPRPVSFSGVLTIGFSFITVNSAWERGVGDEREGDDDDEGVGEGSVVGTVGLDLEKSRGVVREPDEPEPEHDALQVPEDPAWLSTLVTSPSRIVSLLLKLAITAFHSSSRAKKKTSQILGPLHAKLLLASGEMSSNDNDLATALSSGSKDLDDRIQKLAARVMDEARKDSESVVVQDPWFSQLDWSPKKKTKRKEQEEPKSPTFTSRYDRSHPTKPNVPLLFKLAWRGYPLFHSREHGWIYRVPSSISETSKHGSSLTFSNPADWTLADLILHHGFVFHKLPHKDGEKANSGWRGERGARVERCVQLLDERIVNQMVVWEGDGRKLGFEDKDDKWGIILPQVISMGTVTRRAIEKTWCRVFVLCCDLTASNVEKNRVGSELKAMVRAPPGYAIIGANVDSEALWVSTCMGDAQFGMHGATALGQMTLEGTKGAGTALRSKTAKILGLSRDQAKVFNYSRIYGAGMKHAGMSIPEAQKLAENLYASTKGRNTHRSDMFDRKFWFGGSESFVFNKLEEIANSEKPRTPALGCSVTYALSKEYLPNEFGSDYMPSIINWVFQSSGVDYLHMLIVSMEYLIKRYHIQARYLISVHDELRYLVKEEDKYRAALALQISNLWTRAMFVYMLGMDDLGRRVFFGVSLPIPPGEGVLERTGGSLGEEHGIEHVGSLEGYEEPDCMVHRANTAAFLKAHFGEVKELAQKVHGVKFEGGIGVDESRGNGKDEDELTHYRQSLSNSDDFDDVGLRVNEEDEEDENGQIDKEIVRKTYLEMKKKTRRYVVYSGGSCWILTALQPTRKKTKAEVMTEAIAKSKEHELLRQMEKEIAETLDDCRCEGEFEWSTNGGLDRVSSARTCYQCRTRLEDSFVKGARVFNGLDGSVYRWQPNEIIYCKMRTARTSSHFSDLSRERASR